MLKGLRRKQSLPGEEEQQKVWDAVVVSKVFFRMPAHGRASAWC
jgi:hypothetical protein